MVFATANHFRLAARPILHGRDNRDWTASFGASPEVCAIVWNLCDLSNPAVTGRQGCLFKHLLWALLLLKTYGKGPMLCSTAKCCRTTYRDWVWPIIFAISGASSRVVCFESGCCYGMRLRRNCSFILLLCA